MSPVPTLLPPRYCSLLYRYVCAYTVVHDAIVCCCRICICISTPPLPLLLPPSPLSLFKLDSAMQKVLSTACSLPTHLTQSSYWFWRAFSELRRIVVCLWLVVVCGAEGRCWHHPYTTPAGHNSGCGCCCLLIALTVHHYGYSSSTSCSSTLVGGRPSWWLGSHSRVAQ